MRKMKKLLALGLSVAMVAGLTACGSAAAPSENPAPATEAAGTEAAGTEAAGTEVVQSEAAPAKEGDMTITLWSIATESDAFHPSYLKAIEEFEGNHPGVKINFETFENESYKTKLKAAIAANELPDIFFTWGGGFSTSFVESGKVLPLDSYYPTYQEEITKAALANATYDGTLYGTVLSTPVSCMFYNKKMLEERGMKAPETWEDFTGICQKFVDEGIAPIGTSVKDTWVLAMLHDGLTLKSAGPEKTAATVTGAEGTSYNDPDFLASATKIKELVDMGAFIEGATGFTNDEAKLEFCNGVCPFYITGNWLAGDIQTYAQNPDDFDVAPIPVINADNAKITDFMGGASDTFMVAASTPNPDMAATAAFEITRSISHYAYLDGAGIPAWKVNYDVSEVDPITQKVAGYTAGASSFTLWFDTLMSSDNAGEYLALLQQLYFGDVSPEEFVEAMADQLSK